ncbi:hypothetical protein T459_16391 [Capsicum annuum]|uniref:RRM domain-containing protein n=1 Tax=Capsicum annuum TaxID=4072 RepID=A0A2G2Z8P5_CAPAN|nr:hypothetical protein T459_16391 [Capsicum annuum]
MEQKCFGSRISRFTRNVCLNAIGNFDEILLVQLAIYQVVNLPKRFASYVEFKTRTDAKKAQLYMDGAQIDRKVVHARFTLPEQKKATSPTRVVATS